MGSYSGPLRSDDGFRDLKPISTATSVKRPVPDVAFEYKKLFKVAKLEKVYNGVPDWLRKKGVKVRQRKDLRLSRRCTGRA